MDHFAIIMSGGRGKRFWPLSQEVLPKQFLPLAGDGTLFQQTYKRLRELLPAENIYTITRQSYRPLILEQVEEFLTSNIIVEPKQRNTAPCIALGITYILHKVTDAVVAILPSDHYIADEKQFLKALETGLAYAEKQAEIVTFGIKPDYPHTGFGYIKVGDVTERLNDLTIFRGESFIEKPNLENAERLISTGEYFWNSGIFVSRASVMLESIRQNQPVIYDNIKSFQNHIGSDDEISALIEAYERIPNRSIDKGVMENVKRISVIPIDVGWSDLGSWASLRRIHPLDHNKNLVLGKHLLEKVSESTVVGSNKIVVIGLDNVIVASNGEYVLVCAKDQEHMVQEMVDKLENETR
jgi:mannose-1-phosphate guanylyltransferase